MKSIKTIWLCAIAFMACAFAACSSDDEPEKGLSGADIAQLIKIQVLTGGGNEVAYPEYADAPGVHAATASNAEAAHQLCESLIHQKWDGKPCTVTLPDNCGSIRVGNSDKEGVFHILTFNVKTIPNFTLEIVTPEYFDNQNYITPIIPK